MEPQDRDLERERKELKELARRLWERSERSRTRWRPPSASTSSSERSSGPGVRHAAIATMTALVTEPQTVSRRIRLAPADLAPATVWSPVRRAPVLEVGACEIRPAASRAGSSSFSS